MTDRKKERSSNFTEAEVQKLVALVREHQNGVNCNRTGVNKGNIQKETWEKISTKFNAQMGGSYRSGKVLKTKYKNVRTTAAKKFADIKTNYRGTGGGPPKKVFITEVDETVREIHGMQVTGSKSKYDDDLFNRDDEEEPVEVNNEEVFAEVQIVENEPFEILNATTGDTLHFSFEEDQSSAQLEAGDQEKENHTGSAGETSWKNYTPSQLRTPVTSVLQEKKNKQKEEPLKTKIGNWAKSKLELALIQKTTYIKENEMKITHLIEKHNKALQLMENESKLKIEFLKREHEARMELIKKQKM